jgi:hypothetical protein
MRHISNRKEEGKKSIMPKGAIKLKKKKE